METVNLETVKTENRKNLKAEKTNKKDKASMIVTLNFKDEEEVYAKFNTLLDKCNEKDIGKKIMPINLIVYAINLLKDSDVTEVQNLNLTGKDKFQKLLLEAKNLSTINSEDEFYEIAFKTLKSKMLNKSNH